MWLSVGDVLESRQLGSYGKAFFVLCILDVHCLVFRELPPLQCMDGGVRSLWTSSTLFFGRYRVLGVPELKGELWPDNPALNTFSPRRRRLLSGRRLCFAIPGVISSVDLSCVGVQFFRVSWVQHLVSLSPLLALLI
jgi:hypothetical protein